VNSHSDLFVVVGEVAVESSTEFLDQGVEVGNIIIANCITTSTLGSGVFPIYKDTLGYSQRDLKLQQNLPISTPSVPYLETKSTFHLIQAARLEAEAAMGEN